MSAVKERIIGAVTVMQEEDAELIWHIIQKKYAGRNISWEDIEEIVPDEWDLEMLKEIEINPDCKKFVSSDAVKTELGL